MKFFTAIAVSFFLLCCNNKTESTDATKDYDQAKDQVETQHKLLVDTLKILNNKFVVVQSYPGSDSVIDLRIINSKYDTIYIHNGHASNGFEFEDFDGDGILDIRLHQLSNPGGLSQLIMFDKLTGNFKPVENFESFFSPEKILGSKYWYSYHRSGCADVNWDSDLFYIEDFKAIRLGNIAGRGCHDEPKHGIFVYKIKNGKEILIKEFIRKEGSYEDKWELIEEYWNKNYKLFE